MANPWTPEDQSAFEAMFQPTLEPSLLSTGYHALRGTPAPKTSLYDAAMGLTGGSIKVGRVAQGLGEGAEDILRTALRSMGREGMQWLRKSGKRIRLVPEDYPTAFGRFQQTPAGGDIGVNIPLHLRRGEPLRATAAHEGGGHGFAQLLPERVKAPLQEWLSEAQTREMLEASAGGGSAYQKIAGFYPQEKLGEELFAQSRELPILQRAQAAEGKRPLPSPMDPDTIQMLNRAARIARKRLGIYMQQMTGSGVAP